jgi:hypothetical protein
LLKTDHKVRKKCLNLHCVGGDGRRQTRNDGSTAYVGPDGVNGDVQHQTLSPNSRQQRAVVQVVPQTLWEVGVHMHRSLLDKQQKDSAVLLMPTK